MQPTREQWIPNLPDGLADPTDRKKMINDRHAKLLRETAGDANFVRLFALLFHAHDFCRAGFSAEFQLQFVAGFLSE